MHRPRRVGSNADAAASFHRRCRAGSTKQASHDPRGNDDSQTDAWCNPVRSRRQSCCRRARVCAREERSRRGNRGGAAAIRAVHVDGPRPRTGLLKTRRSIRSGNASGSFDRQRRSETWEAVVKLRVELDDEAYEVDVDFLGEAPVQPRGYIPPLRSRADGSPRSAQTAPRTPGDDEERVCRCPLRGLVARVNIVPGQPVRKDEIVMVLEAMKMETEVPAPRSCIVKSVSVAPGDSVTVGQVLVEFDWQD